MATKFKMRVRTERSEGRNALEFFAIVPEGRSPKGSTAKNESAWGLTFTAAPNPQEPQKPDVPTTNPKAGSPPTHVPFRAEGEPERARALRIAQKGAYKEPAKSNS